MILIPMGLIDLMHDDVTHPKGRMVVVVTLKSKMAVSSGSSGGNSIVFDLTESSNKSPEPLLDDPATSEHMSAFLPFTLLASGEYDAILDSCVTTTTTMHVRAAKALFYVIMYKVYYFVASKNQPS